MCLYDVYLSYSGKDKLIVRWFAKELRNRNLTVWFDEWSVTYGDDIYLAIERGLQESRVQVLFMSKSAFSSEWVDLERSTIFFRDPLNNKKVLSQFLLMPAKYQVA